MADNIDKGLDELAAIRLPGESFTTTVIASYCQCHRRTIYEIEKRALAKLSKLIKKHKLNDYMDDAE